MHSAISEFQPPFKGEVIRLKNPRATLWGGKPPVFESITSSDSIPAGKRIVLFIHGMEYGHRLEVLKDLVKPLERGTQWFHHDPGNLELLFIHWDSRLRVDHRHLKFFPIRELLKSLYAIGEQLIKVKATFEELEWRAKEAASSVSPIFKDFLSRKGEFQPLVITHSLGALVWSEIIRQTVEGYGIPDNLGQWWNMQPALEWNVFQKGKSFESISDAYLSGNGQMSVWYSKTDFILSTLFLAAKRNFAMGQVGIGSSEHQLKNMTHIAREAHGQAALRPHGCYFSRVRKQLYQSGLSYIGV